MRYELVSLAPSEDGAVAELRLSGAPLGTREALELAEAAGELLEDRAARAVVISSAGADFCPGGAAELDPLTVGVDPAAALARLRVPVLVAVRGRCHSVGLELAMAGDIVLASPEASFALPDVVEAGRLPCWGGTQRLPRAFGAGRASAMLLLGESLDAARAQEAGFVWQVVDDPGGAAAALARQLAALGPLALEYAKEAVHRGAELPLRDGLRLEGDLNTLLATSADRAEGLAAFFAKRPADFAGR